MSRSTSTPPASAASLRLLACSDGRDGAVTVHADAALYAGLFDAGESAQLALDPRRLAYVHMARGKLRVNGVELAQGDAAKFDGETRLQFDHGDGAEVLVFDLAR